MQHQVVELECPGCAAIITTGTKTCPYCFRPIVITSFNSIRDFSSWDLNKQANVYKKAMADHPDDGILNTSLALGMRTKSWTSVRIDSAFFSISSSFVMISFMNNPRILSAAYYVPQKLLIY